MLASKIGWTDGTWNPWIGCSKVASGCQNCYAEAQASRFGVEWGPGGTRRVAAESAWAKVRSWNRKAEKDGQPLLLFPSLCDPFEDWPGPMIDHYGRVLLRDYGESATGEILPVGVASVSKKDWTDLTMPDVRRRFWKLIDATPWIIWILLTKRPENVLRMWPWADGREYRPEAGQLNDYQMNFRPNVWLLFSASNQEDLDAKHDHLLDCKDLCPVRGLSLEPLIGPIDLVGDSGVNSIEWNGNANWVIGGGESGSKARPCNVDWLVAIADQCKAAGVPFYMKQYGSNPISGSGQEIRCKAKKGDDPSEWIEPLKVQEFPRCLRSRKTFRFCSNKLTRM
jgi:protein gp37